MNEIFREPKVSGVKDEWHLLNIFVLIFEARETFNFVFAILSFTRLLIPEVIAAASITGYSITRRKEERMEETISYWLLRVK